MSFKKGAKVVLYKPLESHLSFGEWSEKEMGSYHSTILTVEACSTNYCSVVESMKAFRLEWLYPAPINHYARGSVVKVVKPIASQLLTSWIPGIDQFDGKQLVITEWHTPGPGSGLGNTFTYNLAKGAHWYYRHEWLRLVVDVSSNNAPVPEDSSSKIVTEQDAFYLDRLAALEKECAFRGPSGLLFP